MNQQINDKLTKTFESLINTPSDINEHLLTLLNYSKECKHITELGVRWIVSTYSFILSNPNKLISIDIKHPVDWEEKVNVSERFNDIQEYAKLNNIDYSFILADTLQLEIEETDLLFIDTLHVYQQLKSELELHGNKSRKYIFFHDTTTYGFVDEIHGDLGSALKNNTSNKRGLMLAIREFLDANPHWKVDKVFENCNGLTILRRD